MLRAFLTLLVAAVGSLAIGGTIAAAAPPPGDAGISQYVETVPTSGGGQVAGSGGKHKPLTPAQRTALRKKGGKDAGVLNRLSTSSAYGAPQKSLSAASTAKQTAKSAPQQSGAGATTATTTTIGRSASSSGASSGSGGSRLPLLLAIVAAAAVLATIAAAIVQRRHRRT